MPKKVVEELQKILTSYLLGKPDAVKDFPFGPETAVYKIGGKMFALVSCHEGVVRINLKCDPVEAMELRTVFACVLPGYHMNKKHWNTIILDGTLPMGELKRQIDNSYNLVVRGLSRAVQQGLKLRYGHG